MDESTANMDTINENEVSLNIAEMMKGKTVIVVAHNLNTILKADNILFMDRGRVLAQGTHSELYKNEPLYRRMIDMQK